MTCEELLTALNDYVDDETVLAVCQDFAQHLAQCNPCQIVVDNIRNTIKLFQSGAPVELPSEFYSRLQKSLREKWTERYPVEPR